MNYLPKTARCKGCSKRFDDCLHLPFHTMPVHRQDGTDTVVICTEFATASGEVGRPFFHDRRRMKR